MDMENQYIVRLYDRYDRYWIDVTGPLGKEKADEVWNKETRNGTMNAKVDHGDYYCIFPADTRMMFNGER